MPLGGVIKQFPPVGGIAVDKIVSITVSANPYAYESINKVKAGKIYAPYSCTISCNYRYIKDLNILVITNTESYKCIERI